LREVKTEVRARDAERKGIFPFKQIEKSHSKTGFHNDALRQLKRRGALI
jgi:hypothetical protein